MSISQHEEIIYKIRYNISMPRTINTLKANDINFSRVWVFWGCETLIGNVNRTMVIPYLLTGPGNANDGKSKQG